MRETRLIMGMPVTLVVLDVTAKQSHLDAVFEDFVAEYRDIHRYMTEETRGILRSAQAWIKGGPEPSWASGLPTMPGYTF